MSKPLWSVLLLLTGALALWRGAAASFALWEYHRLGPDVPAQVVHWELVPKGSKYALKAAYTYNYNGRPFSGSTLLPKPYYLNRASAEGEIQKMSGMMWTAWVDPKHPSYSSLDKTFPLRQTAYAICLVGIFLYFIYLNLRLLPILLP